MFLPKTVGKAVRHVYEPSEELRLHLQAKYPTRRIFAEDFHIITSHVPRLRELCLRVIADNYAKLPVGLPGICNEDWYRLHDTLSVHVDLKFSIETIEDEFYWERCCRARWKTDSFSRDHSVEQFWKKKYCSRYMQERIEKCYAKEGLHMSEITLIGKYIEELNVRHLPEIQKSEKSGLECEDCEEVDDVWEKTPDHVQLEYALPELVNMRLLCLAFPFDFLRSRVMRLTRADLDSIGRGIFNLPKLREWRLLGCCFDECAARALTACLLRLQALEEFEVSHCDLDDAGLMLLSYVLMRRGNIEELALRDDSFGPRGMQALCYAIVNGSRLKRLDLSRNELSYESAAHLSSAMVHCRPDVLNELVLAGCALCGPAACMIAGALKFNASIEILDVSSNEFSGEPTGVLLESLRHNSCIKRIDLRNTVISTKHREILNEILSIKKKLTIWGFVDEKRKSGDEE